MRLFVALDIPSGVRRGLAELIDRLRGECRSARWMRPDAMHLTLKFIGHAIGRADGPKFRALHAALGAIHLAAPAEALFRGVGFFPHARHPRVLWCGMEGSPNLAQLAARVEDAVEPLGVPRETRDFLPHLTLARLPAPADLGRLLRAVESLASEEFGSARWTEFHLYESVLKRSGAEYRKLESYSFLNA